MAEHIRESRAWAALCAHPYLVMVQLVLVLPALNTAFRDGSRGAFAYLSGDCLYYFVVARNIVNLGSVTFDQQYPTNGFHPLWQLLLAGVYGLYSWTKASDEAFVLLAFLLSLAVLSIALTVLYAALRWAYGPVGPLFLMFPIGVYGISAYWHSLTPIGTLQSFANGMESSLLLLSYAMFLVCFLRYSHAPSMKFALAIGLSLAAIALSRLDHALLAVAAAGVMVLHGLFFPDRMRTLRDAVIACLTVAAVLGLYLAWSRVVVGSWMPVSGTVKAGSFDAIGNYNLRLIRHALVTAFSDTDLAYRNVYLWRSMQLVAPMVIAVLYVVAAAAEALLRRAPMRPMTLALVSTGLAVIGLAAYNAAFVQLIHQGEWYMPVGVLFVSLVVYDLATRWAPRAFHAAPAIRAILAAALLYANYPVIPSMQGRNSYLYDHAFGYARALHHHYGDQDIRMLSYSDAVFAYGVPYPTMSGMLLTADPEAVRLFLEDEVSVLEIAYDRGYHHIPVIVADPRAYQHGMTSEEIKNTMMYTTGIFAASFPRNIYQLPFDFAVDFIGEDGRVVVIKMVPRDEDA